MQRTLELPQPTGWIQQLKERLSRLDRLFLLTVLLPTVLASLYYGLIASDVYVSESSFVVRSSQRQPALGLGALLQSAGFSRAQDDTYAVQDYMLSRDALRKLNDQLHLDQAFSSSQVDLFNRFGALDWDRSFEALHRYFQKRIEINVDTASSISLVRVRAFTAQDSYRINAMLLDLGEKLINQINERARQDMIRFASSEVASAERRAQAAALELSAYRARQTVVDPERQSVFQLQQVSKLQDDLIATQTQLSQLRAFTPQNPQIPSLEKRAQALQAAIDTETGKIVGNGTSLTNKAAQFQRLALEREFADKQLASALASLEQARNEAQRKQLYLERIAQPSEPDIATEPRRMRGVFATFVLGLIAWGILTILVAGIREHHD
ncbi:capsule export inner-membrane protein CtrB [Ralstonia solanacearum]|uniref:capsule export inner-membrane protein CtrB n=1 Tax=Ralstonia solanacearum TaxID=305 RepID=UPI0001D97EBC|nr:capsule export inner-membrane protein CtrB [Ralstonia solanacearum]CBJ51870.1 capsule export inner-membrane protein CtrB [Ralstonia solanacearum PSI07]